MELHIVRHRDILFKDALRVADIKNKSWEYPIGSQLRWMIQHFKDDDMHVFLKEKGEDIVYMDLVNIQVLVNEKILK